jgi:hypothetical protein
MKEGLYLRNKDEVFIDCGLKPKQKGFNCHHIFNRSDKERHKLPKDFQINNRSNLIPLPIHTHEELHWIDDHYFHNDITTRVYLANMAFNQELDIVPDRFYRVTPKV